MAVKIPVSDARRKLSELLKDVSNNPEHVYEITVNDIVFGELRTPSLKSLRMGAGGALLRAAEEARKGQKKKAVRETTARDHDEYLYPARPRRARGN
jgi:hypothetical protein